MSSETTQMKPLNARSFALLRDHFRVIHQRTDRLFAGLLLTQWVACIAAAVWISPRTWIGESSETHIHVWSALILGGAVCIFPVLMAVIRPGETLTRHVIAVSQMLTSAMLIHFTGGRIETHFHVFGSLALLAAYRDWRVLLTASLVIAADHGVRGAIWPESVYGVLNAAYWRTLEHAGWILFEGVFLCVVIRQSILEMRDIAGQRSELEATNRTTEEVIQLRTAELQEAEERLRLIIDSVPNGLVMIDEAGIIRLVNAKMTEMFGYEPSELLGQKIEILVPASVRPKHPGLREQYVQSAEVRPMGSGRDLNGTRKDGSEFPVELGLNPLRTDDGIFVVAAVVDITERKKSELELKEYATQLESTNRSLELTKKELEQKNSELDEFAYVASHDLQEPVRKLVSFSKLLEQDVGNDLNQDAQQDLEFIVQAAERMRRLIQDLLALSRAGRSAMASDEVDLNQCRDAAMDALQLRIEESGAQIRSDHLPTVVGDRTMFTQLYQNLIGNALKFVADQSPIVSLTAQDQGDHWLLGVKDNGIGMKPEHAERIFKPFQRLHRRNQYEGTGIGLSICRKTVERHFGQLWVESQLGQGAQFFFTIPKTLENTECASTGEMGNEVLQSC